MLFLPVCCAIESSNGIRTHLQRAPKGTSSRIVSLRLQRSFRRTWPMRHFSHSPSAQPTTAVPLSDNAIDLLRAMLHDEPNLKLPPSKHKTIERPPPAATHPNLSVHFKRALAAVQRHDPMMLLFNLRAITKLTDDDLRLAVDTIPRSTFTEFFRSLDPLHFAAHHDVFTDSFIPVGMYKILNMSGVIDDYGVRKLYVRLLRSLLSLMAILDQAGYNLHMDEYIILFRCAGAASDIAGVSLIMRRLNTNPAAKFRLHPDVLYAFVRARFLVHPLYTSYRKNVRAVDPWKLAPAHLRLFGTAHYGYHALRQAVRHKKLNFGLNKDTEYVDELMAKVRTKPPVDRQFRHIVPFTDASERMLCAFIIAYGRCAQLRFVESEILLRYFSIDVTSQDFFNRENQFVDIPEPKRVQHGPKHVRPTVDLMRAIVEAYGSNAEIAMALKLVVFIYNTFRIRIPADVWLDLLEWTHLHSVPPASTAWSKVGLASKVPGEEVVKMIWETMTWAPYNVVPTFRHYRVIIRSLIGIRRSQKEPEVLSEILLLMRQAIVFYDQACREFEEAGFAYTQQLRDSVDQTQAAARYQTARATKETMWYEIADWCRSLLKKIPVDRESPVPNAFTHDFIQEFRRFVQNPIEYSTSTGFVSLRDPGIETFRHKVTGQIEKYMRYTDQSEEKWRLIRQQQITVFSSHSLAEMKATNLDPLHLLAPPRHLLWNLPRHS
ncbi:mitochondrial ATPase expression-domain-containing protein [Xylariaceae sp. FL0255]|nr:mitochondrial ATPase expression-domain-containing protein [Xylariaceae sp. FL0255]